MTRAAGLGPTPEIYSIDESFVGVRGDLVARAFKIRSRILRWTGIPTCIGIAPTKTLAKLANHISKTAERKPGSYPVEMAQVCSLAALPAQELDAVLQATSVSEVWGVGRRIAKQLQDSGIHTVLDLARMDPATIRRRWSVILEKTVRELQGQLTIELDDAPEPKQQIACTRSFGQPVSDLAPLLQAVSEFAGCAAEKLRKQQSLAIKVLCSCTHRRTARGRSSLAARWYRCVDRPMTRWRWLKLRLMGCGRCTCRATCLSRPA